jgi:hypothetical protein
LKSRFATSSWGGRRKRPLAFTEHGAIQAATILNNPRAVEMSIYVVRAQLIAFVRHMAYRVPHDQRALACSAHFWALTPANSSHRVSDPSPRTPRSNIVRTQVACERRRQKRQPTKTAEHHKHAQSAGQQRGLDSGDNVRGSRPCEPRI